MVTIYLLAIVIIRDVTCSRINPRVSSRYTLSTEYAGDIRTCSMCKPNTTLSQFLWDETRDIRQKSLTSKIISGVRSGLLDPVDFGKYMMQDAIWCGKTGDAAKIAAQRVRFSQGVHLLSFLQQKANDYYKCATNLLNEWQITNPSAIKQSGGLKSYYEYEIYVAQTMNVSSFLTCIIPSEKLWPWIGEQISNNGTYSYGPYTDWVKTNLDPTLDRYIQIEKFVDEMHARGELDEKEALEVYRNCMMGELEFFSDP